MSICLVCGHEAHLRHVLTEYFEYYNRYRVHQSLEMETPDGRNVQTPEEGIIVAVPHVNGLHHHYERKAA
jgi:putative transposase